MKYERVRYLEERFKETIDDWRFIPFITLHEFEALLFSSPEKIASYFGFSYSSNLFGDISKYSSPEEIDEGEDTHPSARIKKACKLHKKAYRKISDGISIAKRIGLETIHEKCPHFDKWLKKLEKFCEPSNY